MDVSMKDLIGIVSEGHVIEIEKGSATPTVAVDGQTLPDWTGVVTPVNDGSKIVVFRDHFVSALIFDPKD